MVIDLGVKDLLEGVKYVLDFMFLVEGVELVDFIVKFWLFKMVKLWFFVGYYLLDLVFKCF